MNARRNNLEKDFDAAAAAADDDAVGGCATFASSSSSRGTPFASSAFPSVAIVFVKRRRPGNPKRSKSHHNRVWAFARRSMRSSAIERM